MIDSAQVEDLLQTKEQLIKYLGQLESKNIPRLARRVLLFDIPNLAERLGYIIEHIQESVDILCNDKQSKERLYKHFAQFMQELLEVGLITNAMKKPSVLERIRSVFTSLM